MMESGDVVLLVAAVGVLVLLGVLVGFLIGERIGDRDIMSLRTDADDLDWPKGAEGVVDAEVVEEREPVRLPLDPDNPPTWRIARRDRPDVFCSCHNRPVREGERLLFWPMGDGEVRVYHDDATEAAGQ